MLTELSWVLRNMLDLQPEDPGLEYGICIPNASEKPGPWLLRGKSLGSLISEPAEGRIWSFFLREGVPTMTLVGCMAASLSLSKKGLGHACPSEPLEPGFSPTPSPELATSLSEPVSPVPRATGGAQQACPSSQITVKGSWGVATTSESLSDSR